MDINTFNLMMAAGSSSSAVAVKGYVEIADQLSWSASNPIFFDTSTPNIVTGDTLLLVVFTEGLLTAVPTGWTLVDDYDNSTGSLYDVGVYRKSAVSSSDAPELYVEYTGTTRRTTACLIVVSSSPTVTIPTTIDYYNTGSSSSWTASQITVPSPGGILFAIACTQTGNSNTLGSISGMVKEKQKINSATYDNWAIFSQTVSAGATGTRTITPNITSVRRQIILMSCT